MCVGPEVRREELAMNEIALLAPEFTARELRDAEEARIWMRKVGNPSLMDAVRMTSSMKNCPVTASDCRRAVYIYGRSLESIRGKTTTSNPKVVKLEEAVLPDLTQDITIGVDLLYANGEVFLLSVSSHLDVAIITHLGHNSIPGVKAGPNLLRTLELHTSRYTSKRFHVTGMIIDNESGVSPILPDLKAKGLYVDPVGAGDHVTPVERKIRTIKERVRGMMSTSPFRVCKALLIGLVIWAVAVVNIAPTKGGVAGSCPSESFLGRKIDLKRDFRVVWGTYCETTEPIDNAKKNRPDVARTRPGIAMFPTGNANGSWYFYSTETMKIVSRTKWTELRMTPSIIERLNGIHDAEAQNPSRYPSIDRGVVGDILFDPLSSDDTPDALRDGVPRNNPVRPIVPVGSTQLAENNPVPNTDPSFRPAPADSKLPGSAQLDPVRPEPEPPPVQDNELSPPLDYDTTPSEIVEERGEEPKLAPKEFPVNFDSFRGGTTRSGRRFQQSALVFLSAEDISDTVFRDAVECGNITFMEADPHASSDHEYCLNLSPAKALQKIPVEAAKSIFAEISQLDDRLVFHPRDPSKLSAEERRSAIRSSMFLKEKYQADGTFEKLKTRLVAGGNMQDKSHYYDEEISSPTPAITSVFMTAAIAANEKRIVITGDMPGAYLHADLPKGPGTTPILMRLNQIEAQFLVKKRPDYTPYLLPDGTMIVELDKALYGLVESARLWFENMSDTLKKDGFIPNPYDICVFNKIAYGVQITIVLYVDDLLITSCSQQAIDDLLQMLTDRYKAITVRTGPVVNYLGMTMDFSNEQSCRITMKGYIDDVLEHCKTEGQVSSPAAPNLFEVNPDAEELDPAIQKEFHSRVMKLFYLAKRVRPDILVAIQFLATRVLNPDIDDWKKLERCLKYLNGSRELGINLEASGDLESFIVADIDASFGVHMDGKSQSACTITLGKGAVYAKLGKQKFNTKSSHESELVSLSDGGSAVLWSREFIIAQGYNVKSAVIHQDNMSTIASINKGRPCGEKSRHINIRYFWLKDRVDTGEIRIEYLPTEEMTADILTKPLQGELFRKLRAKLLNWHM